MARRASRAVALGVSVVCALSIGPAGATAASHPQARLAAPGKCPTVMPESALRAGQKGTGWTVERGQTREAFTVKILGVLPDGIGPGVDMIVIKIGDEVGNDMIKRAGGIWAGMSGSPVYIGSKLVGAVSYGFTSSPSRIGGMTPAEPMLGLLGYPPIGHGAAAADGARQVRLPAQMAARAARAGGISTTAASTLTRLAVPLAVSGLDSAGRARLQDRLNTVGMDVIVTPGNSVAKPSGSTAFDRPKAGGNFAGLLSYGDVTSGGIGTATYVCGNQAVAFGHPLMFGGRVGFGASNANAIAVVRDNAFGSFKLASIGAPFGRLDQDRLTGIRATLAKLPHIIPVTSNVSVPSLARNRFGETDLTTSALVSSFAPQHLYENMVVTLDKQGPGNAQVSWTVEGQHPDGTSWSLSRSNRFSSTRDIAGAVADDLFTNLLALDENGFENVNYKSVAITATAGDALRAVAIDDIQFSLNGGIYRHRSSLNVHPGDHLTVRVLLTTVGGVGTDTRYLSIVIPNNAFGSATLVVSGGGSTQGGCGLGSSCGTSFNNLLHLLATAPHNNDLLAQLVTFDTQFNPVVSASDTKSLPTVVSGGQEFEVTVQ